jgi:hypothetical protein
MAQIIIAVLIVHFFIWIIPDAVKYVQNIYGHVKQKLRNKSNASIFENNSVQVRSFFPFTKRKKRQNKFTTMMP